MQLLTTTQLKELRSQLLYLVMVLMLMQKQSGTDVWTDLAVLKINGDNVTTTMDFANSDDIAVGETAFAIGSPLDVSFSNTVTKRYSFSSKSSNSYGC